MPCRPNCGLCCEAIAIRDDTEVLDGIRSGEPWVGGDMEFLPTHYHEITREEALRRNRHLVMVHDDLTLRGNHTPVAYFECDLYDWKNKACGDHENRPHTCRDFPFYRHEPEPGLIAPWAICGYWEDLTSEQRMFPELELLPML